MLISILFTLSCSGSDSYLKSKGYMGADIKSSLEGSEECTCRKEGADCCNSCKDDKKKLENWLKEDNLISFKDEEKRNKLMILISELERGIEFKKGLFDVCFDKLIASLDGNREENLKKIKEFDAEDSSNGRSISYMLLAGMLDSLKKFVRKISCKVEGGYDFGISEVVLEGTMSPFCLLADRVKDEKCLSEILDGIVDKFPCIADSSLDELGNIVYHLCSIYGNAALFKYFRERSEFRLGLLRMENNVHLTPVFLAIKCKKKEIFRSMLEIELEGNPKGFDTSSEMKEYGRKLILISAIFCNDDTLDILFLEKKASKLGSKLDRIKKTFTKVGKVLIDVMANTADTASYYATEAAFGVAYKGNLATTAVNSIRTHCIANKPVSLNEKKIQEAFYYLKRHYDRRLGSYYGDFKSKERDLRSLIEEIESLFRRNFVSIDSPISKDFYKMRKRWSGFLVEKNEFFGNAVKKREQFLKRIVNNYLKFKDIRLTLIDISNGLKDLRERANLPEIGESSDV